MKWRRSKLEQSYSLVFVLDPTISIRRSRSDPRSDDPMISIRRSNDLDLTLDPMIRRSRSDSRCDDHDPTLDPTIRWSQSDDPTKVSRLALPLVSARGSSKVAILCRRSLSSRKNDDFRPTIMTNLGQKLWRVLAKFLTSFGHKLWRVFGQHFWRVSAINYDEFLANIWRVSAKMKISSHG